MKDYSTYLDQNYQKDLNYCKQFIFSFGSNYKLGTQLFPRSVREATVLFYAFVRYADEIVDNPNQKLPGQTHISLDEFIVEWEAVIEKAPNKNTHPILRSNYYLFKKYEIPFEYTFDFLEAMKQDTTQKRYSSYKELQRYMWGSAAVVGHVMTFIVGYSKDEAFDYARALGEAMQLANFLRDVEEDYQKRNRIYLPHNDMVLFAVTEKMISEKRMTPQLHNFIRHYVERTEELFHFGIKGISYLQTGKFSIFLASRMYRENIRILKRRDYNIFGKSIRLSNSKKVIILLGTFLRYPFWQIKNYKFTVK